MDGPWCFLVDFVYCISEVEIEDKKMVKERKDEEKG